MYFVKMIAFIIFIGVTAVGGRASQWLAPDHARDHDYDRLTPDDQRPHILTAGDVIRAVRGDNVTLECDVDRLGKYSVIWQKNKEVLWLLQGDLSDPKVQFVTSDARIGRRTTSLVISDVRERDQATYSCEVSTFSDQVVRHDLIVHVPASVAPLEDAGFVQSVEGETAELECRASGRPTPEVTWQRQDGKAVRGESAVDSVLQIHNVTATDAGVYACVASNSVGAPAKAYITLQVQYAPTVTSLNSVVHSGLFYDATLWCVVDAVPFPKVTWLKHGAPVNPMRLRKGMDRDKKFFLLFDQVLEDDFGLYSCNATNFFGNGSATVLLTGAPLPPTFTSGMYGTSATNYTLVWEVKSFAPVTHYHLFLRNFTDNGVDGDDDAWVNITVPVVASSSMYYSQRYALLHLSPSTRMVAKVQALNEYGSSNFSDEFVFQTFSQDESSNLAKEEVAEGAFVGKLESSPEREEVAKETHEHGRVPSESVGSTTQTSANASVQGVLMSLKDENGAQNASTSSSGASPGLTAWERRVQVMSIVTAFSLSCFLSYFAMRS